MLLRALLSCIALDMMGMSDEMMLSFSDFALQTDNANVFNIGDRSH